LDDDKKYFKAMEMLQKLIAKIEIIYLYPFYANCGNIINIKNIKKDKLIQLIEKTQKFHLKERWYKSINRTYLNNFKIKINYKHKLYGKRSIEMKGSMYINYMRIFNDLTFGFLWLHVKEINAKTFILDDLFPLIHIIYDYPIKINEKDYSKLEDYLNGVVRPLLSYKHKTKVFLERPIYGISFYLNQKVLEKYGDIKSMLLEFANIFYGLSVGDEGYLDFPATPAKNRVNNWTWSTRIYFAIVVSPSGSILLDVKQNRIERERIILLRPSWLEYIESHSSALPSFITNHGWYHILEWATLTISILSYLQQELKQTLNAMREKSVDEILKILRTTRYKYYILKEFTLPESIAVIPEVTTLFESLFNRFGVQKLKDYFEIYIGQIDSLINELYSAKSTLRERMENSILSLIATLLAMIPVKTKIENFVVPFIAELLNIPAEYTEYLVFVTIVVSFATIFYIILKSIEKISEMGIKI